MRLDLSGGLILGMQKVGLVRNVIAVSPERQESKALVGVQR